MPVAEKCLSGMNSAGLSGHARNGAHASKDYDAPTLDAAMEAAERDLRAWSRFRVIDVWIREGPGSRGESLY